MLGDAEAGTAYPVAVMVFATVMVFVVAAFAALYFVVWLAKAVWRDRNEKMTLETFMYSLVGVGLAGLYIWWRAGL